MDIKHKIFNTIKSNLGLFLFSLFFIILYREFLHTYKIQLEQTIPYFLYQPQIEYYLSGDENFNIGAPASTRFVGLWIQYVIYNFFPCIELSREINFTIPYENYVCSTFANAFMNYLCLCGFLTLSFMFSYNKLNLDLASSFLTVILSFIFLKYVESFTLDRLAVLYYLFVLYFLDNKKITIILILFGSIVNEKIIYILAVLFFIRLFINNKKTYLTYFVTVIISSIFVVLIFVFYAFILEKGFIESDLGSSGIYQKFFSEGFQRIYVMFLFKQGYSNAVLPLFFTVLPYLLSLFIKVRISSNYFSRFDFLIPISLLFFTAGAGMEQTGRYVMLSMPLWLPILSQQVIFFFRK